MMQQRRLMLAMLAGCLAVMLGSGSVMAAPGDVSLVRLSGLGGEDYWLGTAATPTSVYVGGTRNDTAVLRRYNRSGGVVWTRTLVTPGSGPALIWSVAADASGVYAVGEYTTKERHGFVARYYPNGTFVWLQPLGLGIPSFAKGITMRDSSLYVTGMYSTVAGGDLQSVFVRKYTTDADEVWTRTIEPDPEGYLVSAETRSIATTADHVFVVGDANVDEHRAGSQPAGAGTELRPGWQLSHHRYPRHQSTRRGATAWRLTIPMPTWSPRVTPPASPTAASCSSTTTPVPSSGSGASRRGHGPRRGLWRSDRAVCGSPAARQTGSPTDPGHPAIRTAMRSRCATHAAAHRC